MVDNDPERMTLAELTSLPDAAIPAGALTEIWSRKASLTQQRNADELALELNPDYTGPHFLKAGHVSQSEIQERQRQAELRAYEQTMAEVQDRSQILLDRIDKQMIQDQERLQKIEQNAIHLHDGRAVYADVNGTFRDRQGALLQGNDAVEAQKLHEQKPGASTWSEKRQTQQDFDGLHQLREKVQTLHDSAKDSDGASLSEDQRAANAKNQQNELSDYEKQYSQQVEHDNAALPPQEKLTDDTFGGDDYMAAYAGTSVASSLDGNKNKVLSASFSAAAAGQTPDNQPAVDNSRPAPVTAPAQVPSR
jgi:hypothetical protein